MFKVSNELFEKSPDEMTIEDFGLLSGNDHFESHLLRLGCTERMVDEEKRGKKKGFFLNCSSTNRICCRCCVFGLFSIKVCPWYKHKKNPKKSGNHAGVRYVHMLSVPGIQFRVVPVSLRVFSGHKMMRYTKKVGSTTFTNLRRHRGLDFHSIFNSRVDIYTPSSTVKDGDYRVVGTRILKSGRDTNQN